MHLIWESYAQAGSVPKPYLCAFVALTGFEPISAESESDVLPLHHRAINVSIRFSTNLNCYLKLHRACSSQRGTRTPKVTTLVLSVAPIKL